MSPKELYISRERLLKEYLCLLKEHLCLLKEHSVSLGALHVS